MFSRLILTILKKTLYQFLKMNRGKKNAQYKLNVSLQQLFYEKRHFSKNLHVFIQTLIEMKK